MFDVLKIGEILEIFLSRSRTSDYEIVILIKEPYYFLLSMGHIFAVLLNGFETFYFSLQGVKNQYFINFE